MKTSNRYLLILIGLFVFLFSIFQIISYLNDLRQNKYQVAEVRTMYYSEKEISAVKADAAAVPQALDNHHEILEESIQSPDTSEAFRSLKEVNEDTVGWISIAGTSIDYPVVQSQDNIYYLDRDFKRKRNRAGSIFMDFRNNIVQDRLKHIILYGHNMKNGSMFADLLKYESLWNFENHSTISFGTLYEEEEKWIIFSAYFTDIHHDYIRTDFQSDEDFLSFIHDIQEKSLHSTDIKVFVNDIILTLSTCSSARDDQRFAVHAVRVK